MPQFINSKSKAFGDCAICGPGKSGYAKTFSAITTFEGCGVVRIGDEIISECGHSGFVNSGSSIVSVEGMMAALSTSTFAGEYTGYFIESITNIGE